MTKELELSKKLAVLGWIFRKGLITEDEYNRTRIHIMGIQEESEGLSVL